MSWNKNTIVRSSLDSVKFTLDKLDYPYELSVLATVRGRGLNDDVLFGGADDDKTYEIRRLKCDKFVVLEQMLHTFDCDSDDYLSSQIFNEEPKLWQPIVEYDEDGNKIK